MSDHEQMTKTTPKDFIAATLGGLIAPGLTIFMIVMLFLGVQHNMGGADPAPIVEKAVYERIHAYGSSLAVDPNVVKVELSGEQVYNEVCTGCHASGALGSPKFKESADWGKRISQGYETLLDHAIKGFNKMPVRGGDPDLTDMEVARGIVYMTNAVGAQFEAVLKKEVEPSVSELAAGQAIYASDCASCHNSGMTGAQKLTDGQAWVPLIKEGKAYLYNAAINGSFGGPAKGGNLKLSDADTRLAVDYMVETAKSAIATMKKAPSGK